MLQRREDFQIEQQFIRSPLMTKPNSIVTTIILYDNAIAIARSLLQQNYTLPQSLAMPEPSELGTLGKLPPEIRDMVYNEIFGPTKIITPKRSFRTALSGDQLLQSEVYIKAPVHTCILAASKKIKEEALDVLYRDRTVRTSMDQLGRLSRNDGFRNLVKWIEIDDHFMAFQNPIPVLLLGGLPRVSPQIRSITILSDRFAFTQHNGRTYITVREFATMMHLGEAVCVGIGRFQLRGRFSHVQIVHRKLVQMWPNVASTPEDYDVFADVLQLPSFNDDRTFSMFNVGAWAAHTSLRRWVGLYDEFLRVGVDLGPYLTGMNYEQRLLFGRFVLSLRRLQHTYPGSSIPSHADYVHQRRMRNRPMNKLGPSDGPEMLAWATDVLSVNIAAFFPLRGVTRQPTLQRAH